MLVTPAFIAVVMLSFAVTLVRHGETQCNKDGLLQGQKIDSPLSEIGIRQSEAAGRHLGDVMFTNVFVSDMKRAKQTAEIIVCNNRRSHHIEIVENASLKERSFGVAEGGRVTEMKNMAQAAQQSLPEFTPPEGETMEEVKVRIKSFLKTMFRKIATDHQDRIQACESGARCPAGDETNGILSDGLSLPIHALVVGHGAYMSIAMRYFFEELKCPVPEGSDPARLYATCPNTGMCRFIFTLSRGDADPTVSGLRCVFINRRDHFLSE